MKRTIIAASLALFSSYSFSADSWMTTNIEKPIESGDYVMITLDQGGLFFSVQNNNSECIRGESGWKYKDVVVVNSQPVLMEIMCLEKEGTKERMRVEHPVSRNGLKFVLNEMKRKEVVRYGASTISAKDAGKFISTFESKRVL